MLFQQLNLINKLYDTANELKYLSSNCDKWKPQMEKTC